MLPVNEVGPTLGEIVGRLVGMTVLLGKTLG